jgi:hypothetical protein
MFQHILTLEVSFLKPVNEYFHLIMLDIIEHQPTSAGSIGKRTGLTSKAVGAYTKTLLSQGHLTVDEPRRVNGVRVPRVYWAQTPCGCAQDNIIVLSCKTHNTV